MISEILKSQPHIIKGKKLDCKLAIPKEQIDNFSSENSQKTFKRNKSISSDKKLKIENKNNSTSSNNKNLIQRKMFIGGLHPLLTEESINKYFSQFGVIEKIIIMKDKLTGRSRGFGFIIFSEKETIDKILFHANCHFLYGKWVECKRAEPKIKNKNDLNLLQKNYLLPKKVNFNDDQINNSLIENKNKLFNYSQDGYFKDNYNLSSLNNNDISRIDNKTNNHNINEQEINSFSNKNNLFLQLLPNDNDKINKKSKIVFDDYKNGNIIINKKLESDNKKFQDYFNKYINNPSWYKYFHYKLFDIEGTDLSKLSSYIKNNEKIKLFPEERDDKSSNSNSSSQESNNEKENKTKEKHILQTESLFGPDRTNIISKDFKPIDNYKPY